MASPSPSGVLPPRHMFPFPPPSDETWIEGAEVSGRRSSGPRMSWRETGPLPIKHHPTPNLPHLLPRGDEEEEGGGGHLLSTPNVLQAARSCLFSRLQDESGIRSPDRHLPPLRLFCEEERRRRGNKNQCFSITVQYPRTRGWVGVGGRSSRSEGK